MLPVCLGSPLLLPYIALPNNNMYSQNNNFDQNDKTFTTTTHSIKIMRLPHPQIWLHRWHSLKTSLLICLTSTYFHVGNDHMGAIYDNMDAMTKWVQWQHSWITAKLVGFTRGGTLWNFMKSPTTFWCLEP